MLAKVWIMISRLSGGSEMQIHSKNPLKYDKDRYTCPEDPGKSPASAPPNPHHFAASIGP